MKSYILPIAICFAVIDMIFIRVLQCSFLPLEKMNKRHAYIVTGYTIVTDVELLRELMLRNDSKDEKAIDLENKFTCAVACFSDAKINVSREEIKSDLMNTLDTCHQKDEGDNCNLLECVKVLIPPFKALLIFA
uniref:Putative odorant binding protein 31 n=1 Tax=Nasonia vitripennis TaxID=7425 RepID=G8B1N6_NASVI|nr:putative odorant binding protein 31 [Nasonia vitripennis]